MSSFHNEPMILPTIFDFFWIESNVGWVESGRLKVADKAGCHLGSKSEFWNYHDRGRKSKNVHLADKLSENHGKITENHGI